MLSPVQGLKKMVSLKKPVPTGGTSTGSNTPKSVTRTQKSTFRDAPSRTPRLDRRSSDFDEQQRIDVEVVRAEVVLFCSSGMLSLLAYLGRKRMSYCYYLRGGFDLDIWSNQARLGAWKLAVLSADFSQKLWYVNPTSLNRMLCR